MLSLLVLLLAGTAAHAQTSGTCMYYVQELPAPLSGDPVLSAISVSDAFNVGSVRVQDLSLESDRLGALKITLSASLPDVSALAPPETVLLKDTRDGGLATRLQSAAFDDTLLTAFPPGPRTAPSAGTPAGTIEGSFYPARDLNALALGSGTEATRGGSRGVWTLRIAHLGSTADSALSLESWTLVLCPAAATDAAAAAAGSMDDAATTTTATPPSMVAGEPAEPATPSNDTGLITASAREEAENATRTTALLAQVLGRINFVPNSTFLAPRDGTVRDSVRDAVTDRDPLLTGDGYLMGSTADRDGILATRDGFMFGENSTVVYIQERVDELLSGAGMLGNTNASVFGSFRVGNTTLPQGPTVQFLQSLRSLADDLDASDLRRAGAEGTPAALVSAQDGQDMSGRVAALLSSVASLDTGAGYLESIGSMLSGLASRASQRPVVAGVATVTGQFADNRAATTATVGSLAQSALDFSSAKLQNTVALVDSQSGLLEAAVRNRLAGYENALESAGELIAAAINDFSDTVIAQGKAMRVAAMDVQESVSVQKSALRSKLTETATGRVVSAGLQNIANTGTSIAAVADSIKTSFGGVLQTLLDVYRTQLSTARSVLSTSTNAQLNQAQFRAESAIDTVASMVATTASALEAAAKGKGPLVGTALETYALGLGVMNSALSKLREVMVSPADVEYGSLLRTAVDDIPERVSEAQEQLAAFYDSLGLGARATKAIGLLGGIDRFTAAYEKLLGGGDGN